MTEGVGRVGLATRAQAAEVVTVSAVGAGASMDHRVRWEPFSIRQARAYLITSSVEISNCPWLPALLI